MYIYTYIYIYIYVYILLQFHVLSFSVLTVFFSYTLKPARPQHIREAPDQNRSD